MHYTEIFFVVKKKERKLHHKNFDSFLIFAQNIECGYTLETPLRGGFNEYPQLMFWSKNKQVWIISENRDRNYRADARRTHVFTGSTGGSIVQ